ncbi:hypothetical protein DICSQDRAFT_153845 [Dichomitus squalens LYAD-421 SS1]|uniref:uncharacterized protein n=1 Tax=Dichomitus squalens (strain LYAD-421) TaxID=732165 RepID=UPI000441457C|nr:uncharacterized protein DICSQDRAFT_153845 [Dichomitus squalens LYAD-421 SS1]EJF63283.1 hypothetical protein DICSQDRAFT_153845 [Dichomitus squalens LYAD-421 SS1]
MHRALRICEIARSICAFLNDESEPERPSLAALARTCKGLHEPAMEALWAVLDSLVPLLQCLPWDCGGVKDTVVTLTNRATVEEWATFFKYASYVRTLSDTLDAEDCRDRLRSVEPSVIQSICAAVPPGQTLLPGLRKLGCTGTCIPFSALPAFLLAIGRRLTDVEIVYRGHDSNDRLVDDVMRSITIIARRWRNLRVFNLSTEPEENTVKHIATLSQATLGLQDLRDYQCMSIELRRDAVLALASLPALKTCALRLPKPSHWKEKVDFLQPFQNLQTFIFATTASAYVAFSRALPSVVLPVESFDLILTDVPFGHAMVDVISLISRHFRTDRLAELFIRFDPDYLDSDDDSDDDSNDIPIMVERRADVTINSSHLHALVKFTKTRIFVFDAPGLYDIDDNLLVSMAEAWPSLEDFGLASVHHACFQPVIHSTLAALPAFALHCPQLERLALQIDASAGQIQHSASQVSLDAKPRSSQLDAKSTIPPSFYGALRDMEKSPSKLTSLVLFGTPVSNPDEVATFLLHVFPALSDFISHGPQVRQAEFWGMYDGWRAVMNKVREASFKEQEGSSG